MRPERERAESLQGPWPSPIEELQAEYSEDWVIWREQKDDGSHGDWIARRVNDKSVEVRGTNSELLRAAIATDMRRRVQGTAVTVEDATAKAAIVRCESEKPGGALAADLLGHRRYPGGHSTYVSGSMAARKIDQATPNVARMYDYYLGGKDNFPADRDAAEKVLAVMPEARLYARANRAFLRRVVLYLAAAGVRQFLDIGTGLPSMGNVHEVAQSVVPEARTVYVDYDQVVVQHGRAMLATDARTTIMQMDLRYPVHILTRAQEHLDFDQPVAVLMVACLHFVSDPEDPAGIVSTLMQDMEPGSYLVVSHVMETDETARAAAAGYKAASAPAVLRAEQEIAGFFEAGETELIDPGLVRVPLWRPEIGSTLPDKDAREVAERDAALVAMVGGVGVKPR
ncbi:MAG TPA: SAM-dependent methyltransferase [Nonomuraea sp.]|nr:SAM-dependent methyltransferase [Nonomuraea sp.]